MTIELGIPAVAGLAYFAVAGRTVSFVACALGGYAVLMALVQVRLIPVYRRLSVTPGSWAFTFSYAAAAADALVWLAITKPPGATGYAIAVITVLTAFVSGSPSARWSSPSAVSSFPPGHRFTNERRTSRTDQGIASTAPSQGSRVSDPPAERLAAAVQTTTRRSPRRVVSTSQSGCSSPSSGWSMNDPHRQAGEIPPRHVALAFGTIEGVGHHGDSASEGGAQQLPRGNEMLAHRLFRLLGVARLERSEQAAMADHRRMLRRA
jgi:hypothetical protein